MANVLITGAAGFIGSHIAEALCARGDSVSVIDDLSGGYRANVQEAAIASGHPALLRFNVADCADIHALKNVLQIHGVPDVLVHCAANAREGASQFQPISVTYRNFYAYIKTLTTCLQAGVKHVVLFSSMAVYGENQTPFDETFERQPVDVYGVNKASMERVTEILASVHGFSYMIIRPHNVFGERQALNDKFRNVVGIFMNRIMGGEPLFIYGDGKQERAFSYIGDSLPCFIRAIDLVCSENQIPHDHRIVNVGGMENVTVNELADTVCNAMHVSPESYPREHLSDRPCEVKYAYSTYARSVDVLGYCERIGWRRGIELMAKWAVLKGPQPWYNTQPLELVNESVPEPWLV